MVSEKKGFEEMKDLFLDVVFPRYIMKYKTKAYYPVIVGGINVNRCLSSKPKSKALIDEVFSSDIDVDFVIMENIQENDDDPKIFKKVHVARMKFLKQVVMDAQVQSYITQFKAKTGLTIQLEIDDSFLQKKELRVYKVRLVMMRFNVHNERGEKVYSNVIVDCPLYTSQNTNYMLYKRFVPNLQKPIPYYVHNNVPFATCNFVYYDAIRMMIYYSNQLKSNNDAKERHFNFVKYVRYVMKFTMLYLLINRVSLDKEQTIKGIYEEVKQILSRIPVDDKFADIPSKEVDVLKRLIKQLKNKRTSNLNEIQKIISKANTPKNIKGLTNARNFI